MISAVNPKLGGVQAGLKRKEPKLGQPGLSSGFSVEQMQSVPAPKPTAVKTTEQTSEYMTPAKPVKPKPKMNKPPMNQAPMSTPSKPPMQQQPQQKQIPVTTQGFGMQMGGPMEQAGFVGGEKLKETVAKPEFQEQYQEEMRVKGIEEKEQAMYDSIRNQFNIPGNIEGEELNKYLKESETIKNKQAMEMTPEKYNKLTPTKQKEWDIWHKKMELSNFIREKQDIPEYVSNIEIFESFRQDNPEFVHNLLGTDEQEIQQEREGSLLYRIGERGYERMEKARDAFTEEGRGTIAERAIQAAGQVTGGLLGDVMFETLKEGAETAGDAIEVIAPGFKEGMKQKAIDIMQTETGKKALNVLGEGMEAWEEWSEDNPRAATNIEAVFNIGELVGAGAGVKQAERVAKRAVTKADDIIKSAAKFGKKIPKKRATKIAQQTDKVDEVVAQIIQGEKKDIAKATSTLRDIDTSGVKSYSELGERIEDQGEALMQRLDEELLSDTRKFKPNDVKKQTKVGDEMVEEDFITKGIDQLEEMYAKIEEPKEAARIRQIKNKFESEGLGVKEMNDVAREYGSIFGKKAFGKTGEPLTSVNAQAYENIRKGIKDSVRSQLDGDVAKKLDKSYSDLMNTKKLIDDMDKKVQKLSQKVQKRGFVEKLARQVGKAVDVATFGGARGLITSFVPSNVGFKTMNSLDLEKALKKNLKLLDGLLEKTDTADVVGDIKKAQNNLKDLGLNIPKNVDITDTPVVPTSTSKPKLEVAKPKTTPKSEVLPVKEKQ